jgi:hypothetical protein
MDAAEDEVFEHLDVFGIDDDGVDLNAGDFAPLGLVLLISFSTVSWGAAATVGFLYKVSDFFTEAKMRGEGPGIPYVAGDTGKGRVFWRR